jgi:hypothetical protein
MNPQSGADSSDRSRLDLAISRLETASVHLIGQDVIHPDFISETFDFVCNRLIWNPLLHEEATSLEQVILQRLEPPKPARSFKQVNVGLIAGELSDFSRHLNGFLNGGDTESSPAGMPSTERVTEAEEDGSANFEDDSLIFPMDD